LEVRKIKLADKIKDIKKILIFVGGADIYNIGLDLVRDVQYVYPNADLVYVYANADESKSTEKLKIMKPTISIENILSGSDLVICGGGRIKYEACYSGLTVATIAQSDGQFEDSQYICNLNLAMDLGLAKVYSSKLVQERLETLKSFEFREQMLKNSGELFHSFSTDLCVKEIINLYKYKV
jgi:spore coat polysaccharide biosynthesis predicted glycosyltransferase SpsG